MGKTAIPDRWLNYKPIGGAIPGTRFIAFKVPLRKTINKTIDDRSVRLDYDQLMHKLPNLGMIIDLTNTKRYYDPVVFENQDIAYAKLMVPGHATPPEELVEKFKKVVSSFLHENSDNDKLIGVHCTHGVNRTGFFICNYMISELSIKPKEAIKRFNEARGHDMERENYLTHLHEMKASRSSSKPLIRHETVAPGREHRSPERPKSIERPRPIASSKRHISRRSPEDFDDHNRQSKVGRRHSRDHYPHQDPHEEPYRRQHLPNPYNDNSYSSNYYRRDSQSHSHSNSHSHYHEYQPRSSSNSYHHHRSHQDHQTQSRHHHPPTNFNKYHYVNPDSQRSISNSFHRQRPFTCARSYGTSYGGDINHSAYRNDRSDYYD